MGYQKSKFPKPHRFRKPRRF